MGAGESRGVCENGMCDVPKFAEIVSSRPGMGMQEGYRQGQDPSGPPDLWWTHLIRIEKQAHDEERRDGAQKSTHLRGLLIKIRI